MPCSAPSETYPMAAKANSSRASNGNSVLRLVLNTAVMVSEMRSCVLTTTGMMHETSNLILSFAVDWA